MKAKTIDEIRITNHLQEERTKMFFFTDEATIFNKPQRYVEIVGLIKELEKTKQFACLESWCASRENGGKDFCSNCKSLIRFQEEGRF